MTIEQTIDIPPSRRLLINVPLEVPVGKTILTFTPASAGKELGAAEEIWTANRNHPEELKSKLQSLKGSLGDSAFGGLDGIAYQHKIREEWNG